MKKIFLFLNCILITTVILFFSGCSNTSAVLQTPVLTSGNAAWHFATDNTVKPKHIALLLPLSGPYQPYANAIRNGFFTEYYAQKQQTQYAPTITVFNTQGKNIREVYNTAIAQGADFIVGPLDKSDVAQLAALHSNNVTTLALNSTSKTVKIENQSLYEFALSPTDEAGQAAIKAAQDQHHNVIILAPQNALAERMVNAFTAQWKQNGNQVVAIAYYHNIASLSRSVSSVLGITDAYQNARILKNTLRENFRFIPARRQDFDSFFVIANPAIARQLMPLLQFYFAGNTPTYATSQIYIDSADGDSDLDGMIFCNMPWILQPAQFTDIQNTIKMLWPDNYTRLSKFYAMGVDAFDIASQFQQLQSHPNTGMPAATGTLYLTPQHYIYRKLLWAKIENGNAVVTG